MHKLRLTLDCAALKDHEFSGLLYVACPTLPRAGLKHFRTSPPVEALVPRAELQLPNGLTSCFFDADKEGLAERLQESAVLELWHQDRLKSDVLLGKAVLKLEDIRRQSSQKTRNSYCQAMDVYLPVDQYSEDRPVRKVAALRVRLYLEDFGPSEEVRQVDLQLLGKQNLGENQPLNPQKDRMLTQLQSLEYKVVWQLEAWRKSQQMKFQFELKQKEISVLADLAEQQRKREAERERQFKQTEAALLLLEQKLRSKAGELQKRQQKLVGAEQELQLRVGEVSRQLLEKDQEMQGVQKRAKEAVSQANKEKVTAEALLNKSKQECEQLRQEIDRAKRDEDKSLTNQLRAQLSTKNMQIKELTRQLEKSLETKEEYRLHSERLKNELLRVRGEAARQKENEFRSYRVEIEQLREQMGKLQVEQRRPAPQQPFKRAERVELSQVEEGERERLVRERACILEECNYSQSDPLIREYDEAIRQLS